jgi:hypothetical protein
MANFIIKLIDKRDGREVYFDWSTTVDAPVSQGMTREQLAGYFTDALAPRLERVDLKGTSSHLHASAAENIAGNRAGPNETELTAQEIIERYT